MTTLPVTASSRPIDAALAAKSLKGMNAAGNSTRRLSGTVMVLPLIVMEPPELNAAVFFVVTLKVG